MKKLLLSLCFMVAASVFSLSAATIDDPTTKPPKLQNYQRAGGDLVIFYENRASGPAQYQVQRKLFPWGWRTKGSAQSIDVAWRDSKPAKRRAWYRMRVVTGAQKGRWSTPLVVEP